MTHAMATHPNTAPLPEQATLDDLVAQVLEEAKRQGAQAAEAGVSFDTGLAVTVRLGEVETLEFNRDRSLGVTVYVNGSKGSASTADWSREAVAETVRAACNIARHTAPDPAAGLAPAELMAREIPDLDLYHPWPLSPEEAITLARRCETVARDHDRRIVNSEGASLYSHQGLNAYGNSHGFCGGYRTTRHSISCSVIGEEGGRMQRDYWYTVDRNPTLLDTPEAVGEEAARRTVRRLGGRRLATCQAPVLFSREMAAGLFSHFLAAIRGGRIHRHTSFLADRLGARIFPEWLDLHERPHLRGALGSAPFDNEGVATRDRTLVRAGRLEGYVLNHYSARRLGMVTTGNAGGVHNLVVPAGDRDLEGLMRQMDRGLLVTELMGQGINYVTGDYSRGAAGFWVEQGEIAYPVEEITIAGTLQEMFAGVVAIGSDVERRGSIFTGSLLLERMTIAGE